jgi:N-acetylglutamate synthase-like GNAT family acetyltransferase
MKEEENITERQISSWSVRPATIHDRDAVEELMKASYGSLLNNHYDSKLLETALPILWHVRTELLTCNTWYVVEQQQQHLLEEHDDETTACVDRTRIIIGCGGWTPTSPMTATGGGSKNEEERLPHLRHFATHPDYLRKGVGRAIWDRIWKDWCEYNEQNATSSSRDKNERRPDMEVLSTLTAESFYASLGFERVKEMIVPLSEDCPFPAVLMRRPDTLSQLTTT